VVFGAVLARDLYKAATVNPANPYASKNVSLVVHSVGAAFGAIYFFVALRAGKQRLLEARRAAAALQSASAPATTNSAASTTAQRFTSASSGGSGSSSKLTAPSPANKDMRTTPPAFKPRRGFASWAHPSSPLRPLQQQQQQQSLSSWSRRSWRHP
jgi:hypothetical protein